MHGKHIRFDWAMKRLLRNKANFGILEGFLSELLKFNVHIQEILESESNQTHPNDKFNRVDILVKDAKGDYMLIEVQNENQDDYFLRMLYGASKLVTEHLDTGDAYGKLTRIYSINIVYFPLGVGEDYIYVRDGAFKGIHNGDELQLSPKQQEIYGVEQVRDLFIQYYIIKVNQFNDVAKSRLDEWIYFLKNSEIKSEFTAQGLAQAKEVLRVDDMDNDERIAYNIWVKNERIRISEIETAYTDGVYKTKQRMQELVDSALAEKEEAERKAEEAKHIAQMEKDKLIETIRMLINLGVSVENIAERLHLTAEEVESIREA